MRCRNDNIKEISKELGEMVFIGVDRGYERT